MQDSFLFKSIQCRSIFCLKLLIAIPQQSIDRAYFETADLFSNKGAF